MHAVQRLRQTLYDRIHARLGGERQLDALAAQRIHRQCAVRAFRIGQRVDLFAGDLPRRRAVGAARAVQLQQEWNAALVHDDIVREEMNGWTALVQSRAQVDASEESLRIAGENLSISTYSYGEGLATILDVLQAQLSWIQLYSNAIRAHYNYAVAVSDYLRITAQ